MPSNTISLVIETAHSPNIWYLPCMTRGRGKSILILVHWWKHRKTEKKNSKRGSSIHAKNFPKCRKDLPRCNRAKLEPTAANLKVQTRSIGRLRSSRYSRGSDMKYCSWENVSHIYISNMVSGRNAFCLFHPSSFQVLLYRDNAQIYLARCQPLVILFFCW